MAKVKTRTIKNSLGLPLYKYVMYFTLHGKRRRKTIYARDGYDAGRELLRLFPKATKLRQT